ncbi:MAG: 2-octaprenyl-6-methoxyphenyl hydroxylase, partial [Pseudomonadota bacterium]
DDRATALSNGSRRILQSIGLWPSLENHACEIKTIHVSDQGRFGMTRIKHTEEGVDALGYVVENRIMGRALYDRLSHSTQVTLLAPVKVTDVATSLDGGLISVVTEAGQTVQLKGRLIVAADGAKSVIRDGLGIAADIWDYEQSAVITNVSPDLFHDHIAYERFTESGPLAILPLTATEGEKPDPKRCSVVFVVDSVDASGIAQMPDEDFLECLQKRFGFRLGRFRTVGDRAVYPLSLTRAQKSVAERSAIIGNAAHALHPIAGQGFNLGLRDVAALADVLADAVADSQDLGGDPVLNRYAAWRERDQKDVVRLTDGLVRLFRNPLSPVRMGRNLGLLGLDLIPGAKSLLAQQTMGLRGKLPRLARGLGLK